MIQYIIENAMRFSGFLIGILEAKKSSTLNACASGSQSNTARTK